VKIRKREISHYFWSFVQHVSPCSIILPDLLSLLFCLLSFMDFYLLKIALHFGHLSFQVDKSDMFLVGLFLLSLVLLLRVVVDAVLIFLDANWHIIHQLFFKRVHPVDEGHIFAIVLRFHSLESTWSLSYF